MRGFMDYKNYFERGNKVDNGLPYIFLKDDAPDELKDLVYEIHQHFDALPNDWIYEIVREAFDDLSNDKLDDITIEADCYHNDLYKWFGYSFSDGLCNEVMEGDHFENIWVVISAAQYIAKRQIYEAVDAFISYHSRHAEV
jgi:hypothetical protein